MLATSDYLKWAEVEVFGEVKKEMVENLIYKNIIFWYGITKYVVTINGKEFYNKVMNKLYEKFGFQQYNSSMYTTHANGLLVTFNKTLCNHLKKVINKWKRIGIKELGKHYRHIKLPIEHILKQCYVHLSMVLKQYYHLRSKSHYWE